MTHTATAHLRPASRDPRSWTLTLIADSTGAGLDMRPVPVGGSALAVLRRLGWQLVSAWRESAPAHFTATIVRPTTTTEEFPVGATVAHYTDSTEEGTVVGHDGRGGVVVRWADTESVHHAVALDRL
jgi:hypothetical protein